MGTLIGHVSVRDANGQTHSFGPGDQLPDWAARQVTNPRLWEDGDVPFPGEPGVPVPAAPAAPAAGAAPVAGGQDAEDRIVGRVLAGVAELLNGLVVGEVDEAETADAVVEPPPRAGKGSGESDWRAYAAAVGVDVTDIEKRDDIIAFLDEQGIPVG